jgi:ribonuclease PH
MREKRTFKEMREISFETGVNIHAEGSCLVKFGNTHVLCTASVDEKTPHWLKNSGKGWVTAEYGMLPRSTNSRIDREAVKGKQAGRTQEIQRLIGRSLRSIINLKNLGERQIKIDCDVIQADGGTRTASISGGFVALYQAVDLVKKNFNIEKRIIKEFIAGVSAGIIDDKPNLDLDYEEDSKAQVDGNFVICESGKIAEIQTTGEEYFFSREQYNILFDLASEGVAEIIEKQKKCLSL